MSPSLLTALATAVGAVASGVAAYARIRRTRLRRVAAADRAALCALYASRAALGARFVAAFRARLPEERDATEALERALRSFPGPTREGEDPVSAALTHCLVALESAPGARADPELAACDGEIALVENRIAFYRQLLADASRRSGEAGRRRA